LAKQTVVNVKELLESLEATERVWETRLKEIIAERDYGKAHFRDGMLSGLKTAIEQIKEQASGY